MSVLVTFLDGTLNLLRQTNMPPTDLGQPQGTWWWMGAISGDASGGITQFTFQFRERFKNRNVLALHNAGWRSVSAFGAVDALFSWNTGPEKEISGAQFNPTFAQNLTTEASASFGQASFNPPIARDRRLIALGDPQIPGAFTVSTWVINANINGATSTVTMWGLFYDWGTFYRGAPATRPL